MDIRRAVTVIVAVASSLVVASALAIAQDSATPTTFTVVERATTDTVIDVGDPGDTIGDMLAFGNDLYDADNVNVVGRDQGQCFRSNPAQSWECIWTNVLEDGSITVQGAFYDDLRDADFAITGGTGAYADASGWMTLHSRDEAGTELDFAFKLIRYGGLEAASGG